MISLGLHEFAHAWVACRCGDTTARDMGRMTPDPRAHIDPIMTIAVPALMLLLTGFVFGGAKPVPVNYGRLRHPARDMMLVALAGPLMNVLIAVFLTAALKLCLTGFVMGGPGDTALGYTLYPYLNPDLGGPENVATSVLSWSIFANLILAIFNMLPIPPLDGSRVVAFFLPGPLRGTFMALDRFSMLIVVALLFSGLLSPVIVNAYEPLARTVDLVTAAQW